VLKENNNIIE